MRRFKSKDYCEGEKMNPAQPNQTLSICMPLSLKRKLVKHTEGQQKSLSSWVREILKREIAQC
jgi:predicted HicB family RNase H-like nuclease